MRTRYPAALLAKAWRMRAVYFSVAAFCFGLAFPPVLAPAGAQSLSPDQVQQLLQQRQNEGGGANPRAALSPEEIVLEPGATNNAPLPTSRLEKIMSDRAGVRLKQFGYDQLGSGRPVSVPQMGGVQDSYVLGPGDEIVVSLRGQESAEYRAYVDRDGRVLLPKLPPVVAAGRTFGEFRDDILSAIHRVYVATDGYVSIGRLRQVSVLVVGEVGNPGTRILTGLSTPADAILVSGGIKKTGSLRNVKLIRNGHQTTIDLYNLVTQHGEANPILLADGDRIVVPSLGPTVAATGWLRRPGIYELPPGAGAISARGLLSLAGGLEVRGKYRISVLRMTPDGRAVMTPSSEGAQLRDSDVLYVQPAAEQTVNQATLSGGTALAGRYPISQGTKLSEIIKSPGALGTSPYTLLGIVSHRDPTTYLRKLVAFAPVAVLNGTADMSLQTDDVVRVFSIDESQMLRVAIEKYKEHTRQVEEAMRNPGAATGNQLTGDFDFNQTGGKASSATDSTALASLKAAQESGSQQAGAEAVAQALANQKVARTTAAPVSETGTAQYPPTSTDAETQDAQATQKKDEAQEVATFGDIARELGVPPLVLANFLSDDLVRIDGAVRGPGDYLVGPDVSLDAVVQAAGGTFRWADDSGVELTTTKVDPDTGQAVTNRVSLPLRKGMLASYLVQPHDEFRFRKVFNDVDAGTVTVQGEVRFSGSYQITRGEHLSELLIRAGGLTNVAYPYGTIFLRRSAAALERTGYKRAADEIDSQLLLAMSRRSANEKLSPDAFTAMQGFVKELRDTKPLGRISVIADPSMLLARPSADILLEPGDVVYIPQRPSTVTVMGQVLQGGAFAFRSNMTVEDYISLAGGYTPYADESQTFIVLPDGTARRFEKSWLNFDEPSIPPGSTIVVPRDLAPLDLHQVIVDTAGIMSQLAVSAASLAVLSKL